MKPMAKQSMAIILLEMSPHSLYHRVLPNLDLRMVALLSIGMNVVACWSSKRFGHKNDRKMRKMFVRPKQKVRSVKLIYRIMSPGIDNYLISTSPNNKHT
jgi:hypothetical protein